MKDEAKDIYTKIESDTYIKIDVDAEKKKLSDELFPLYEQRDDILANIAEKEKRIAELNA